MVPLPAAGCVGGGTGRGIVAGDMTGKGISSNFAATSCDCSPSFHCILPSELTEITRELPEFST